MMPNKMARAPRDAITHQLRANKALIASLVDPAPSTTTLSKYEEAEYEPLFAGPLLPVIIEISPKKDHAVSGG